MENQPITTKQTAIHYGTILGIASVFLSVILYVLNMHMEQNWVSGLIGVAIIIVVISLGISKFKKLNGNILSLSQALKTGLGIALIGALISIAYTLIFMYIIEPDYMSQMQDVQRQAMIEQNPDMTQDQMDKAAQMMGIFSSPIAVSIIAMVYTLFIGFVVSLIAGLIMKNDK
ncbi:Protein of unknown function [Flavobacteriaceae bacterium MAR_2010_188]|nr:Protein of unknown function [Flavobacteriaceae bacterium MAR_2010_188]